VVIEISDTGCGIGPDVISRVFDPFFTTKETGMGTGLGLSICHGIVAEHGGDIEVESSLGRGTMFRVILPVAKASGKLQADDVPAGRAHG
jgi:signal transduction histidine kinase